MERPFSHLPISTSSRGDLEEDFFIRNFQLFFPGGCCTWPKINHFFVFDFGKNRRVVFSYTAHLTPQNVALFLG